MINKIKHIFNPFNAYVFIIIALGFQFVYLFYFKSLDSPNTAGLYFIKGDGYQYVNYCENFSNYFQFFEGKLHAINSYTSRMPGLCVLYFPIRLLCNQHTTLNTIVLFQTVLTAIASYAIALIALKAFRSHKAFYLTFILYATSTYIANNNHRLYTESLALSSIIFSLYFWVLYWEKKHLLFIFLCVLFLIWCVFLRPFMAPFIGLATMYLLYKGFKSETTLKHIAIFIIPIVLIFGSWTYRNYTLTKAFIPLQSGSEWWTGNVAMASQAHFLQTFGLGWISWDQNSEHTWFMPDETIELFKIKRPSDAIFNNWYSNHIFTKELTLDTLKKARYYYWQSMNSKLTPSLRRVYENQSSRILEKFISLQKKEKPFMYYFGYRFKLMITYIYHRLGAAVYSIKYPFNVGITFLDAIANSYIFIWGSLSILLTLYFSSLRSAFIAPIVIIPIFILIYFAFILRIYESRFITMAFPFLLLSSVNGLLIIQSFKRNKILYILLSIFLISHGVYSVIHDIRW